MKFISRFIFTLGIASLLTACGGGGSSSSSDDGPSYSGVTSAAKITSTNAEALGTSASDATDSAISQETANDANPFGVEINIETQGKHGKLISDIANALANDLANTTRYPVGVTYSYTDLGDPYFCGGSISAPDDFGQSETLNGTIRVSNLCYDDPNDDLGAITINGSMTFSQSSSQLSISSNLTITTGGETESVNMTFTCQLDPDGFPTGCSFSSDFEGDDGKVYRIADFEVYDNFDGTFDFEATFYHPDYGSVEISATNMSFGCASGKPDGGTINITGSEGSSATITFPDCSGYSGDWNDGVSSGMFSGTWL